MFYNMRNTYVLTHFISASSMGLFYAIHGNHISTPHTHLQEPRTSMSMRTLCHTIIQHHQQHSFVGFFFFFFSRIFMCELFRLILSPLGRDYEHFTTISNIHLLDFFFFFFPQGSLCVGCLGLFCPRWVGTMNTSTLSLHTTMSSDTTCWGDKYLGELP